MTPNRRMVNPLLQCSLKMRHTLRTTPEPHLLTKVIPSFPADRALSAGNSYFKGDTVADAEVVDMGSDGYDDTGGFMA